MEFFVWGVDLVVVSKGEYEDFVVIEDNLFWFDKWVLMGFIFMWFLKLVIGVIFGYVVVGGLEFFLWCDMCVVDEDVIFGVYCCCWGVFLIDGGMV